MICSDCDQAYENQPCECKYKLISLVPKVVAIYPTSVFICQKNAHYICGNSFKVLIELNCFPLASILLMSI